MNLWEETIEKLIKNERTFDDILVVCGKNFQITKENFRNIAQKTEYYNGYGYQKVAYDLKLIGKDFAMLRVESNGSEWWEFVSLIKYPKKMETITKLADDNCSNDLEDMNGLW